MKPLKAITIETKRLILRKPQISDAKEAFHNWMSDSQISDKLRWYPHESVDTTEFILGLWIDSDGTFIGVNWVIYLKSVKEVIGSINLYNFNLETLTAEVGYCLAKKYWNMGVASEALAAVINYAFSNGLERIIAGHQIENQASLKVMTKNNMVFYERRMVYFIKKNEDIPLYYYSITKKEWDNANASSKE